MKNGLKTKLTLALSTIALGATLIGAGTFAYFNDVDHVNNQFAAGILDLTISPDEGTALNFDLSNMKPGDSIERYFVLGNGGSLAIKNVLMKTSASNFVDGNSKAPDSDYANFLDQFDVDLFKVQQNPESKTWDNLVNITNGKVTLWDLVNNNLANILDTFKVDGSINIAPTGIPVNPVDKDGVGIVITFRDDQRNQNVYQGDSIKFAFNLTANQTAGVTVGGAAPNGSLEINKTLDTTTKLNSTNWSGKITKGSTVVDVDELPYENPLEP